MSAFKIAPNIYWVGAIDWNLRFCGSYNTPRGTTYNAYLIVDEKIALIDTVKDGFAGEMLARIKEIIDPAKIDYIIAQHAEFDHSGALPEIMAIAKNAELITSPAGKNALEAHFGTHWQARQTEVGQARTVKTGDTLSLGKKTLTFIQAEMLHWPDNMFTYVREDAILFSNDAFGAHIATSQRYADEVGHVAFEEAAKYFAVIVSVYSTLVQKKLKEIEQMGIAIKMIAPAHGLLWRQPQEILGAYKRWASGEAEAKATIVFDTMWKSTEKMAREIARGLSSEGVEVCVFNLRASDWSVIIKEIIESRIILIGSPTLNMGMFPSVGGFLTFLKGIRPPNKKAAAFGSYGWGKGAVGAINEELLKMKFSVLESLELKYIPTQEQLQSCFEYGKKLAQEIR